MTEQFTLTPAGSAALGVAHIEPAVQIVPQWLVDQCNSFPSDAAEEIFMLQRENAALRAQVEGLRPRQTKVSPEPLIGTKVSPEPLIDDAKREAARLRMVKARAAKKALRGE